ncbi:MAG TPA: hypothetical protein VKF62_08815, partial [Planctomycetota bacterium]|nr:hypothetical protein [Planctomycetota bacterium]
MLTTFELLAGLFGRRIAGGPSIVFGVERRHRRITMRYWSGLTAAFLGLASVASAQRFGFTHQMLPADDDETKAVALGDVDGDGDLDAFVSGHLYLNGGT